MIPSSLAPGLTLESFQKHISDRYETTDRARGPAKTFLWLTEEFGELATAINSVDKHPPTHPDHAAARANLEEEFADVIAWLCTMANILDVNLSDAIHTKYLGQNRPEGTK